MNATPLLAGMFAFSVALPIEAQDSTRRVLHIQALYDVGKISIAISPVSGSLGDSIRAILQRDLHYSDRFTVVTLDTVALPEGRTAPLDSASLNRLGVSFVVESTPTPTGLHIVVNDAVKRQVHGVADMAIAGTPLSRDWRAKLHASSDEIERLITGRSGIAATRIAFVKGRGPGASLRVVDTDGFGETALPTSDCAVGPAWGVGSTYLAYSTCGADSRIVLLNLETGRERTLVGPTRNVAYLTPSFSPDGRSVAYARSTGDRADLFIVSTEGNDPPRRVTAAPGIDNTNPIFSPDGQRIVYVSGILGRPELYVVGTDGSGAEVLTNYESIQKSYRSDPDWSPDTRLIAYQERVDGVFQIRTIPAAGGAPRPLTDKGENEQPSWAPDARHVVFTSTRGGAQQLWIADVETGQMRLLSPSTGARLPAWSAARKN